LNLIKRIERRGGHNRRLPTDICCLESHKENWKIF